MKWRIFIQNKKQHKDHHGDHLKKEWKSSVKKPIKKIMAGHAYEFSGSLQEEDVHVLVERLLKDPVTQEALLWKDGKVSSPKGMRYAQVWPKKGVSDPVADSVRLGASDLTIEGVEEVHSGMVFEFWGPTPKEIKKFCESYLINTLVQRVEVI